jgi:hypothetical protein
VFSATRVRPAIGDKDKPTNSLPRSASSPGTPTTLRDLPSRSDEITALFSGDGGPIKNLPDAPNRTWLDRKGWVLAGEQYDKTKMVM